ncbi:MAG: GNAT family N-acetyltransferase [Planctomycetaceae bacterium]|nr:GNAT family N-acetyltransferase [Planctomycetaceae bacterium]
MKLTFHEIGPQGQLPEQLDADALLQSVTEATVSMYQQKGFSPPWTAYLAACDTRPVGTCAFKQPPVDGRVEIAYFTFRGHEGQGVALAMAEQLVHIARCSNQDLTLVARTLPEASASTRILEKLDFRLTEPVEDPEDGIVWEWQLG